MFVGGSDRQPRQDAMSRLSLPGRAPIPVLRHGLLFGLLMLLAACQTNAPGAQPEVAVVGGAGALNLPAAPKPDPEPIIDEDPEQLMGMDRQALTGLLGQPTLVRREAPAEIWQYSETDCVFDLFLYQAGDDARVVYMEARDRDARRAEARDCLNDILRARQVQPIT